MAGRAWQVVAILHHGPSRAVHGGISQLLKTPRSAAPLLPVRHCRSISQSPPRMAQKLSPDKFVRAVWKSFVDAAGLEPTLLGPGFRITTATEGQVNFELDITQQHTNRLGTLHGGTVASMVDLGGSLAVASMGRFATGVSTDLNVTYLSPGGKVGDKLTGTAFCEKIGKTLAYTTVTFYNAKGQLAARGSHTKYVAGTIQDEPYTVP